MVKIKTICILALLVISTNAQSAKFQNTLTGGLALAIGEGADGMNPGVNICLEPIGKLNQYFGLGGHIDYSWMSWDLPADYRGGNNFWDISLIPKLFVPITEHSNFFLDIDPGFCLAMAYYDFGGGFNGSSDFEPGFSMTYQAGFDINQFVISFKIKSAFIKDDSVNWVNFNIGLKL